LRKVPNRGYDSILNPGEINDFLSPGKEEKKEVSLQGDGESNGCPNSGFLIRPSGGRVHSIWGVSSVRGKQVLKLWGQSKKQF